MRIGLTGGIATGKSTVSSMFKQLGAYIVDADQAARKVVEPGEEALLQIQELFGEQALLPSGEMDRKWIGSQIFMDASLREKLNAIIHPRVREYMKKQMEFIESKDARALIIVDVPLLFEVGLYPGMTQSIVVYVPESIQLKRLLARDELTLEGAKARIAAQMDIEKKRGLATYLIDNSGTIDETQKQVVELFQQLRAHSTDRELEL